ncbi:outer membrane beta-barrel protein [Aestuariibacter halophilus]|uniref:Outer membrane beta-barrel protein n=1 Tax=Fluctibacter halophilus TaxID=226011 RepID=A0ABS8G286_9ALTE|nr:outer membrane beta-barrel protein [Aestuariibacter halophilus]MCC2614687.1 outer membrane beta-barrel protein [Aestuariibacter halophilus]
MKTSLLALATVLSVSSLSVSATERMYGLFAPGYAQTSMLDTDADDAGYTFALGYEFAPQWYVEMGYQSLSDSDPSGDPASDDFSPGLQAQGLYLSVLGKAGSQSGELFYRLGLMNVDAKGQSLAIDGVCEVGQPIEPPQDAGVRACTFDEGLIAGVIGLGFDYYLGPRTMLRGEVQRVQGEHDFSSNVATIGLRYNF